MILGLCPANERRRYKVTPSDFTNMDPAWISNHNAKWSVGWNYLSIPEL